MSRIFQAIYEHGLLRPLEPIELADQAVVSLAFVGPETPGTAPAANEEEVIQRQQASLMRFIEKMESLPDSSPADGLTNRDHDQIIYGS